MLEENYPGMKKEIRGSLSLAFIEDIAKGYQVNLPYVRKETKPKIFLARKNNNSESIALRAAVEYRDRWLPVGLYIGMKRLELSGELGRLDSMVNPVIGKSGIFTGDEGSTIIAKECGKNRSDAIFDQGAQGLRQALTARLDFERDLLGFSSQLSVDQWVELMQRLTDRDRFPTSWREASNFFGNITPASSWGYRANWSHQHEKRIKVFSLHDYRDHQDAKNAALLYLLQHQELLRPKKVRSLKSLTYDPSKTDRKGVCEVSYADGTHAFSVSVMSDVDQSKPITFVWGRLDHPHSDKRRALALQTAHACRDAYERSLEGIGEFSAKDWTFWRHWVNWPMVAPGVENRLPGLFEDVDERGVIWRIPVLRNNRECYVAFRLGAKRLITREQENCATRVAKRCLRERDDMRLACRLGHIEQVSLKAWQDWKAQFQYPPTSSQMEPGCYAMVYLSQQGQASFHVLEIVLRFFDHHGSIRSRRMYVGRVTRVDQHRLDTAVRAAHKIREDLEARAQKGDIPSDSVCNGWKDSLPWPRFSGPAIKVIHGKRLDLSSHPSREGASA